MAYHKREQSKDITSNESRHTTPLPTYYSQQLPRWTSKSAFQNQKVFDVKTDLYAAPMFRPDDIPMPSRPQRWRIPQKAILVPWVIAAVFFFTTFWLASIALGVRLFMVLQPVPSNPSIQEVHVLINKDVLYGPAFEYTSFVTLSSSARTTVTVSAPISMNDAVAVPTVTGQLVAAPIRNLGSLELASNSKSLTTVLVPIVAKTSPTGFVTLTRIK